jgi:hypothetical protein
MKYFNEKGAGLDSLLEHLTDIQRNKVQNPSAADIPDFIAYI